MQTLCRSTTSVLRQYPILWLPVAIVEFIDFNLRWLESILRQHLIKQLFLRQSEDHAVLSATALAHILQRTNFFTVAFSLCTLFVYDFFLACAMVATAALLQSIAETRSGTLRAITTPILSSIRRILVFATTLFGLNVIGRALSRILSQMLQPLNLIDFQSKLEMLLSLSLRSQIALERSNVISNILNNLWPIPITLCVVYIIAPLQVRLLQPPDTDSTAQQTTSARIAWFLAIVISAVAVCIILLLQVSLSFVSQLAPGIVNMFQAVTYLISIAIYAPLFIAICLIATPQSSLLIPSESPASQPEEIVPPTVDAP